LNKEIGGDTVPAERPGNVGKRCRPLDFLTPELAGPVSAPGRGGKSASRYHSGMVNVQAVDEVDLVPTASQKSGQGKEPERLGPEIVGRKVIDPGVDQEDTGVHGIRFHGVENL
jgi:hypothetical protein